MFICTLHNSLAVFVRSFIILLCSVSTPFSGSHNLLLQSMSMITELIFPSYRPGSLIETPTQLIVYFGLSYLVGHHQKWTPELF